MSVRVNSALISEDRELVEQLMMNMGLDEE